MNNQLDAIELAQLSSVSGGFTNPLSGLWDRIRPYVQPTIPLGPYYPPNPNQVSANNKAA